MEQYVTPQAYEAGHMLKMAVVGMAIIVAGASTGLVIVSVRAIAGCIIGFGVVGCVHRLKNDR